VNIAVSGGFWANDSEAGMARRRAAWERTRKAVLVAWVPMLGHYEATANPVVSKHWGSAATDASTTQSPGRSLPVNAPVSTPIKGTPASADAA
jgi:hypothetical protein